MFGRQCAQKCEIIWWTALWLVANLRATTCLLGKLTNSNTSIPQGLKLRPPVQCKSTLSAFSSRLFSTNSWEETSVSLFTCKLDSLRVAYERLIKAISYRGASQNCWEASYRLDLQAEEETLSSKLHRCAAVHSLWVWHLISINIQHIG